MRVLVAAMTHQLAAGHKRHVTVCTFMRTSAFGGAEIREVLSFWLSGGRKKISLVVKNQHIWFTCVCVEVVSQQGDCPEGSSTEVTFVWSLIRVALHVPIQVRAPWTCVAAKLALKSLLHTWKKRHLINFAGVATVSCPNTFFRNTIR